MQAILRCLAMMRTCLFNQIDLRRTRTYHDMTACISYVFYVRQCRIPFYRGVHAPQGRIKGGAIASPFPGLAHASPFLCGTSCFNSDTACNDKPPAPLGVRGACCIHLCIYLLYIYLFNGKYAKTVDTADNGLVCRQWEYCGKSGKIY